ncbi:MAG: cysteine peptidase family C39 domain-containing protein, partial [Polyangiales bacterium]
MLSALTDFGRRRIRHFPVYRQHDMMDCGPSCLRMVARHHGKSFDLPLLRERCSITRQGVSLLGISEAAESVGLRTVALKVSPERLERLPVPFIAWWKQNHYVVVYDVTRHFVYVSDPAHGRIRYTRAEFCQHWAQPGQEGQAWGAALLLEPTPRFYAQADRTEEGGQLRSFVSAYVRRYRSLFAQVALGLLVTGLIGLAFPLLTQLLIDYGIGYRDLNFIYLVLGAQFMLFAGRIAIDMLRSWLLLHIGVRISVSIVSDFLAKLMRVRLKFFDTVHIGDIITRINDHSRIEFFLTSTTLGTAFSLIYVSALVAVMFFYNAALATLFFCGAVLTALWILAFVRKRAELNHRHFSELAETQTSLVTIVEGIRDIKISRSERQKRWEWEGIQAKIFDIKSRSMTLAQLQSTGATILSESKDMLVSLIAAKAVIDGEMTLGMMMALTYVMGQVNAPLQQLIPLLQSAQDAKLGA